MTSGLPPAAVARMERFAQSGTRTSLLSVPAALGVESVGFEPVGEVMGCSVVILNWAGTGGCGYTSFGGGPMRSTVQGSGSRYNGFGPYVSSVLGGFRRALSRLLIEATAMRADGVVGISLRHQPLDRDCHEYIALGSAVRARSKVRPTRPFSTDLSGTDFAKLLMSGWVPVDLETTMEMAIRHDDIITRNQEQSSFRSRDNVEIDGHTELAQFTRAAVRKKMTSRIATSGADGLVVSKLEFRMWPREAGPNHIDHIARARLVGTSIAAIRKRPGRIPPSPLSILPLGAGIAKGSRR